MDLKLAHSQNNNTDIYINQLKTALDDFTHGLSARDSWDKNFIIKSSCFVNKHSPSRSPLRFDGIPTIPALELKLYWAKLLSDDRYNSRSKIERRIMPMNWLRENCTDVLDKFNASCLSDIPHPEFPLEGHTISAGKRHHNQDYLDMFEKFGRNPNRLERKYDVVKSNEIEKKSYRSPRVSIAGDFHKNIIINRDQFKAIKDRNIIFLNDLYSEDDIRCRRCTQLPTIPI